MPNLVTSNRFFNRPIRKFFNEYNDQSNNIYCDLDSIHQFKDYKKCSIINHISDYNIFGDKYTHYSLLEKYGKHRSKYILDTYLFDLNNIDTIKDIVNTQPIWIIKPRNDYGRNSVSICRSYQDIYQWIHERKHVREWILQKYVADPLLLFGLKFHIRTYVILHKVGPTIRTLLYNKGFIYTSGKPYDVASNDLDVHLSGEDNKDRVILFDETHEIYPIVWHNIRGLVQDSVSSIVFLADCPNDNNHCYKFLGLDILIDKDYNVYLAEINARLISLKYPPKHFKDELYHDILQAIYNKKLNNLEDIKLDIIENFDNFNNKPSNNTSVFYRNCFMMITVILLILLCIIVFNREK